MLHKEVCGMDYTRRLRDLREDHDLTQQEIADEFGVTKQCVSVALLNAERKAKRGFKPSKAVENMRISLVNKVGMKRRKYEEAVAKAEIAKADYDSAISAYEKFEQEFLNK